jgi:hypothetical protein
MSKQSHQGQDKGDFPHHAWPVIAILVMLLAIVPTVQLSARVEDRLSLPGTDWIDATRTGSQPYLSLPLSALAKTGSTGGDATLQATTVFSQTAFLPMVARNYPPPPKNSFGVQTYEPSPETAAKIAEVGAGWVRIPLRWSSIEPTNTTPQYYHWSASFETWLRQLAQNGIKVILTVGGNPDWAATYIDGPIDRVGLGEFAQFLSAAVARYSVPPYHVRYWELYNEPDNGDPEWAQIGLGMWGNDAEAYADMLAAVYPAMKASNRSVQVVLGGIAFDFWPSEGGPFVPEFLDRVLQHNGGLYFDVMNFHYYPNFGYKWAPYGIDVIGKTNFLRNKLATYGLDKPFICTEVAEQSSAFPGGDDERQSSYVVQAMARGVAARLDDVVWFMLKDDDGYWKSGLLNADWSPKPAFHAYQILVAQLGHATYVRSVAPAPGLDAIEAYAFLEPGTSTQILVAWTRDPSAFFDMMVETDVLTIVDKYGGETVRYDGQDGTVDGRVHVTLDGSPVYLRYAGQ